MSLGDVTKSVASEPTPTPTPKKAPRTNLSALNAEVAQLVAEFAEAERLLAAATAARDAAKAKALALHEEHGLQDLDGPAGRVQVIVALGSRRLDVKKARALLTSEQVEDCTVTGKSVTKVVFRAPKVTGPQEVK